MVHLEEYPSLDFQTSQPLLAVYQPLIMSPILPAELIRDIAETAALDAPNVAPKLCLVSHALKEW